MKQSRRPILRTIYLSRIEDLPKFETTERKDLTVVKCNCETCGAEIDYRLDYLFHYKPKKLECCPCNTKRNKLSQKLKRMENLDESFKEGVLKDHVVVESLEDCKELKECRLGIKRVFYVCKGCGKEIQTTFSYISKDFKCAHCRGRSNQKRTSERSIQVNGEEDVENLKKIFNSGTKITYYCRCCGDPRIINLGRFRSFTCQKCSTQHSKSCKYYYEEQIFDSSWELAFYIYLENEYPDLEFSFHPFPITYYDPFRKIQRKYFPDFEFEDHYLEIKGPQLLDEDGKLKDKGKQIILDELEVAILGEKEIRPYIKYVEDKFGKGYLRSFRKKRSLGKRQSAIL